MSDDGDWQDDRGDTLPPIARPGDGGIPLDAFWALLDPIEA